MWPQCGQWDQELKWTRRISTRLQGRHTIITPSRKGCSYRQNWVSCEEEPSLPINTVNQGPRDRGRRPAEGGREHVKIIKCSGAREMDSPNDKFIQDSGKFTIETCESLAWKEFHMKSCNKISFKFKKKNFRDYLIQFSAYKITCYIVRRPREN